VNIHSAFWLVSKVLMFDIGVSAWISICPN